MPKFLPLFLFWGAAAGMNSSTLASHSYWTEIAYAVGLLIKICKLQAIGVDGVEGLHNMQGMVASKLLLGCRSSAYKAL
jgi:hypothetical protein